MLKGNPDYILEENEITFDQLDEAQRRKAYQEFLNEGCEGTFEVFVEERLCESYLVLDKHTLKAICI